MASCVFVMQKLLEVELGLRMKPVDFGGDPDQKLKSGSVFPV